MKDKRDIRPSQTVDRAIHALREMPIPAGPSQETLRAVLAAAGESNADRTRSKTTKKKIFKMNHIAKVAAACVVAGIAVVIVFLALGNGGTTIAFAEVRKRIQEAQTLVFDLTYTQTHDGESHAFGKAMFKNPGLIRFTVRGNGAPVIIIVNVQKGKLLSLNSIEKTAVLMGLGGELKEGLIKSAVGKNVVVEIVDEFRKLVDGSGEPLGKKIVNGKNALGFRATIDEKAVEIWVDRKSGDILFAEIQYSSKAKVAMHNIELNRILDDSLFSMAPPEGYKLIQAGSLDPAKKPCEEAQGDQEKILIEGIRLYAKCNRGIFPAEPRKGDCRFLVGLNNKGKYVLTLNLNRNFFSSSRLDEVKQKCEQAFAIVNRCRSAIVNLKKSGTWKYVGKGVKLGDAKTAVFWYKPKDSEIYKIIYGDLTVKDVAKDDLPTTKPAPAPDTDLD